MTHRTKTHHSTRLALLLCLAPLVTAAEPVSVTHGNITLHGELTLADGSTLADGVVLMLHGTLASHRMELIRTLGEALAQRGSSSLAVSLSLDAPDRDGMRDCALPHRHRHEDAVAELARWRAWLAERGAGPVTLLGHSRGGNQAARYALRADAGIDALVLVAPATEVRERTLAEFRRRHGVTLESWLERARAAAPDALLSDAPFLYCGPSEVAASTWLSYHDDDPADDTPSLLGDIAVPTLVVAGSEDSTVPDVAVRTRQQVDEDTRLVVIDGADHFFLDFYAEDLADAVVDFMGEHQP